MPQTESTIARIFASTSMTKAAVSFSSSSPLSVFEIEIPQVNCSTTLCLHDNLGLLSDSAVPVTTPPINSVELAAHPMITISKLGIVKPNFRYGLIVVPSVPREPKTIRSALLHSSWKGAMLEELTALCQNKTWVLIPHIPHMHVIDSKWVFKSKLKLDGSLDRLKAHLVAKGYHQQDCIDFM